METLEERYFSDPERKTLAAAGKALPHGGFPIETREDVKNAVRAIGRAGNKAAAKAHIRKRAAALGALDLLPKTWGLSEAWEVSEARSRAVQAHLAHMRSDPSYDPLARMQEFGFGQFIERLHPRRHGKFVDKPGTAHGRGGGDLPSAPKPKKKRRRPSGEKVRRDYEQRVYTPEGQAHLEKIKGRVTRAEGGGVATRHWNERTVNTPEQQAKYDEIEARYKAREERERKEDADYERESKRVHADYMKRLGPEGRKLHAEAEAAHEEVRQHSSFEYPDYERERKSSEAWKRLKAHTEKHGIKPPKYPQKPYRHVPEP
jgi:hypothetical protein